LSTTNPTWPDLGSKPGRRCGKPATNRLSYGSTETHNNDPQIVSCIHLLCDRHFVYWHQPYKVDRKGFSSGNTQDISVTKAVVGRTAVSLLRRFFVLSVEV
jgi:hypothetical protein